jgi:predicted nucleotidyltransferase
MKNTSNETFIKLGIPFFKEIIELINLVMIRNNVSFYLIGANAISLQLLKKDIQPGRGTKDIDFAIMISSFAQFEKIKKELMNAGFNSVEIPYTLYHPEYNIAIDLLPFGKIERFEKDEFIKKSIDIVSTGFDVLLAQTDSIKIENTISVNVPPLPALCILKLISWDDRPEMRMYDIEDLYRIISIYFEYAYDDILEKHFDLLEKEPFEQISIAAEVLGRNAKNTIIENEKLRLRIKNILEKNLETIEKSSIAKLWASKFHINLMEAEKILSSFLNGFK